MRNSGGRHQNNRGSDGGIPGRCGVEEGERGGGGGEKRGFFSFPLPFFSPLAAPRSPSVAD